jgi:hypothetical protein
MYLFRSRASSSMREGVGLSVGLSSLHRSTSKLLVGLASTVIFGAKSHGAHDHTLPSDGSGRSGSLQAHFSCLDYGV